MIQADSLPELFFRFGLSHARENALGMILMRMVGQGRVSELWIDSEETLRADCHFRALNLGKNAEKELADLNSHSRQLLDRYIEGINRGLKTPWELKLLGYSLEPWKAADVVLFGKMMGYLGMAECQGELELLLVELACMGIPKEALWDWFPDLQNEWDDTLFSGLRFHKSFFSKQFDTYFFNTPSFKASNSWAISGSRTKSGAPILSSDVHMEINRDPALFQSVHLKLSNGRYLKGASIPGIPCVVIGRNNDVAWCPTYSFMDAIDSWVENCQDGQVQTQDGFKPLEIRLELIKRRTHRNVSLTCVETPHGLLDLPTLFKKPEKISGKFLATQWSPLRYTDGNWLNKTLQLIQIQTAQEGMDVFSSLDTAWNWVFADRKGALGYQMSGKAPRRNSAKSGLLPLHGWDARDDWNGVHSALDLPRRTPEQLKEASFFVTANHNLNHFGNIKPINMQADPTRFHSIEAWLSEEKKWKPQDMSMIQMDAHSPGVIKWLRFLKPYAQSIPHLKALYDWDRQYLPGKKEPILFENLIRSIRTEFYSVRLGKEKAQILVNQSTLYCFMFHVFDEPIFQKSPHWLMQTSFDEIFNKALSSQAHFGAPTLILKHVILGGRLPRILGFEKGPYLMRGARDSIHQTQTLTYKNRRVEIAAAYRMATDMSENNIWINQPTVSGIQDWLNGIYKPY